MMLSSSRRIAICAVRPLIHPSSTSSLASSTFSSSSIAAVAISRRGYAAKAHGPEPKLDPLSPPIPGELDPRFGDLPWWNVPEINRQTLTETPVEPYYDVQNRRYYGEPVNLPAPRLQLTLYSYPKRMRCWEYSHTMFTITSHFHLH